MLIIRDEIWKIKIIWNQVPYGKTFLDTSSNIQYSNVLLCMYLVIYTVTC